MDPVVIERLIEQGRDGYEARLAAGQARLKAGDLTIAIEHLRRATAFDPDRTMAWQALGQALNDSGNSAAARQAWEQGVEVARTNGDQQAEKVMTVWLRRLDRQ